jgi:hypothetical protein
VSSADGGEQADGAAARKEQDSLAESLDAILAKSTGLKKSGSKIEVRLGIPKPKSVAERLEDLDLDDREQTIRLKRVLAYGSFGAVGLQLALANWGMYLYASAIEWRLASEVVMAWLAATVVETLGVVVIIARNLFPSGNSDPAD